MGTEAGEGPSFGISRPLQDGPSALTPTPSGLPPWPDPCCRELVSPACAQGLGLMTHWLCSPGGERGEPAKHGAVCSWPRLEVTRGPGVGAGDSGGQAGPGRAPPPGAGGLRAHSPPEHATRPSDRTSSPCERPAVAARTSFFFQDQISVLPAQRPGRLPLLCSEAHRKPALTRLHTTPQTPGHLGCWGSRAWVSGCSGAQCLEPGLNYHIVLDSWGTDGHAPQANVCAKPMPQEGGTRRRAASRLQPGRARGRGRHVAARPRQERARAPGASALGVCASGCCLSLVCTHTHMLLYTHVCIFKAVAFRLGAGGRISQGGRAPLPCSRSRRAGAHAHSSLSLCPLLKTVLLGKVLTSPLSSLIKSLSRGFLRVQLGKRAQSSAPSP